MDITGEEFEQTYKFLKVDTSLSSVRHAGYYKALLDNPRLVALLTVMLFLPFSMGLFWTTGQRSQTSWIITLFESDLNQAKRILMVRRLIHHLESNHLINEMQFGLCLRTEDTTSKFCPTKGAVTWQYSHNSAFIDNDVIGPYTIMLVNHLVLVLICLD